MPKIPRSLFDSFERNFTKSKTGKGLQGLNNVGSLFGPPIAAEQAASVHEEDAIRKLLSDNRAQLARFERYMLCLTIAHDPHKGFDYARTPALREASEIASELRS